MIELYSRQVVGWSMITRMTATLTCDAPPMVLFRREFREDLITAYSLKQSMSRKGNCGEIILKRNIVSELFPLILEDLIGTD
ncbi:conserved hypothetical protein [Vibrio nigripulchritudo SOn1]|uniref:Uncharacterized protein n=1 Tax=Vibrio nigripulchritudo SOn1 TaxID=1238450 RepID=A0AAV2VMQ1_9VIBR|nr:conserved hypothetical protein [Vibrio nigripulchritudo SOn1]